MVIMKIFKKNQILFFIMALALVTTGYLAYNPMDFEKQNFISTTADVVETSGIGDATLVSSTAIINEVVSNIVENSSNNVIANEKGQAPNTVINNEVGQAINKDDYFVTSRIERDKMYSQMLENYQKIVDNPNIPSDQKGIAINEIDKINKNKNSIMIAENLIKTKGIDDVIIFINDDSVNVVITADELTSNNVAQVQNIISRELNAGVENIHISKR